MRSIKNISKIFLVAMLLMLTFVASPASAANEDLPEHSIYIGNTAVSVQYLINSPVEAQALVNQLIAEQELKLNDLWYQINEDPVKNIGTGAEATPEDITNIWNALKYYYDADGVKHDIVKTYDVTFTVVDESEAAIADATVTFDGEDKLTGEDGVAVFESVTPAEYPYMVSKEGYISQDGTVTVVDEDVAVGITLAEVPETYDVTFTVVDESEAAIADATVTLGEDQKLTGEDGTAVFEDVSPDEYTYMVSKDGYVSQDGTTTVTTEDVSVDITLVAEPPETFDVTFNVKDESEAAIADATVTFDGEDKLTGEDGVAVFENVSPAEYPYMVSKEGYVSQDGTTTVTTEDVTVDVTLAEEVSLTITDVEALSTTEINAEFETGSEVTEAILADKTVALTCGDEIMVSTYVADSLEGLNATFALSGEDVLVDAAVYDLSADWATFAPDYFMAKIPGTAKYIAAFDITTTKLANIADNPVYFTAFDQYGDDLTLTPALVTDVAATAMYADNQFPLEVAGNVGTYANGTFTLTDTLVKGKEVKITLTNGDKAEDIAYLAVEEIIPEATSIEKITGNSSLTAGGNVEILTADVRDQLGNPYTFTGGEQLRWTTSNYEIVEFNRTPGKSFANGVANASTIEIKPKAVGSVDISVYLPDGTEVKDPFTVTVGEGDLATIDASNADVTVENMVTQTEANVNVNSVTAPNVTFKNSLNNLLDVSADSVDFTHSDKVTIEKVANGEGSLTGIIVSADGTNQTEFAIADNPDSVYNINVSVGDISDDFTVTSEVNTTVTDIVTTPIAANVLVVGSTANQTVAFTNVHGEFIDIGLTADQPNDNVSVTITGAGMKIDAVHRDVNATTKEVEFTITYNATAAASGGSKSVMVESGDATETFQIVVGSTAAVKTVDIGSTVTVIGKDDYNDNSEGNNTVFIDGKSFEVMPIAFKNQYGNSIDVKGQYLNTTDIDTLKLNITGLTKDGDSWYAEAGDDDLLKAIGVYANLSAATTETFKVGVKEDKRATGYAPADVTVTVTAERIINDFTLSADSFDMVIGGTKTVYIATEDQYGIPRNVTALGAINVTSSDKSIVTNNSVTQKAFGNYTFTLTAVGGGDATVLVNITGDKVKNGLIEKDIGVSVDKNLKTLAVPNLVSGKDNQEFNGISFTPVGKLDAGSKVMIDLSKLAAAGADFSAVDADNTVIASLAAANLTPAFSENKITLTVNADKFVASDVPVAISLRDADNNAGIVDVTAGASGQYNVEFSRSDSVSVDTKAAIIEGNLIDGSATTLNNEEAGQVQDFKFKFDGEFARNQKFEIVVKTADIEYGTNKADDYLVDGANAFVSSVADNPANTTITLTSGAVIASGTEVTVSAYRVDASRIKNEAVDVVVNRLDTNNGDSFDFNVGSFIVISPATATIGTTEITASFLEIANDDALTFTLNATLTGDKDFKVNLTDFIAPFGTKTGGNFVVDGGNINTLSVKLSEPDGTKKDYTPVVKGTPIDYQVTKGTYDYIELSGNAGGPTWVSLTFNGVVEDVVGDAPHDVKFKIFEAENVDRDPKFVKLDITAGANHATKDIFLNP